MITTSAYLRWLVRSFRRDELADPGPLIANADRHVIGQATGYSVEHIAPFVLSLREHFDGAVTLIVDDQPAVKAFLAAHQVAAVTPDPQRGWRPHVVVSRIALFERILSRAPSDGHALLTDIRDVIFQADPLSPPPARIEAFDEQDGGRFGDHAFNRKHVAALVGAELRDALEDRPALCVGTILGPVEDLRRLCRVLLMLCALPRSRVGGTFGADQAAFNLAIHLGLVEATVKPNFSRVATVGVPAADRLRVVDDNIANPDGSVSPIVHQYDRHAHLVEHVRRRWRVEPVARAAAPGPAFHSKLARLKESVLKRTPEWR